MNRLQELSKDYFDPEGDGYDYKSAIDGGISPGDDGHWASRNPKTGQILKGRKHKTFPLTEKGEKEAGYEIYKGEDGKYYSREKKKDASKDTTGVGK